MAVNASEIAMHHLDLTLPSPAENLACDEALLDWCESGKGVETLRFWESTEPFVVVGYANNVAIEVNVAACEARKVPIFRRCTGGGTVVQGPGCLNYSLILAISEKGPYQHISTANQFIMRRNRAALESVLLSCKPSPHPDPLPSHRRGAEREQQADANCFVETCKQASGLGVQRTNIPGNSHRSPAIAVRGHTDLAIGERKFSGNSQRRHKKFLLFHGTFLLNFDLALVSDLLRMPSKEPDYRESRSHGDFITNIKLPAEKIKSALKMAWEAGLPLNNPPWEKIKLLSREKYAKRGWNFKF
jgi:lipoate-protein ligase A